MINVQLKYSHFFYIEIEGTVTRVSLPVHYFLASLTAFNRRKSQLNLSSGTNPCMDMDTISDIVFQFCTP
jgi:hypothetical protein